MDTQEGYEQIHLSQNITAYRTIADDTVVVGYHMDADRTDVGGILRQVMEMGYVNVRDSIMDADSGMDVLVVTR